MRPVDVVRKVCPNIRVQYLAAFEQGDQLFIHYNIDSKLRVAHFIAQFYAETGGGTVTMENMNYSAQRMLEIFGVGHHSDPVSPAEAQALEHKPEAIAERVYGYQTKVGRELGNTKPGDGFTYRGGGILQTTGRGNYRAMGKLTGVDFEGHPELVLSADHALKPALAEWDQGHCNNYADNDDVLTVSRIINVGNPHTTKTPNGMNDRRIGLEKAKAAIDSSPINFKPGALWAPPKPIPTTIPQPIPAQSPKPSALAAFFAALTSIFKRKT